MRVMTGLALAAVLAASDAAFADARLDCIARCETPAATCMRAVRGSRANCIGGVRKSCMAKPPAQQFDCFSTAAKTCARTQTSQAEVCQTTFQTCYAACGARPAGQADYWCSLNFDRPGGTVYREWFCAGTPSGESPTRRCVALLKDAPTAGYSLTCDPLR